MDSMDLMDSIRFDSRVPHTHRSRLIDYSFHESRLIRTGARRDVPAVARLAANARRAVMSSSSPPRATDGASCVVSRDAVFTVAVHPSALRDPLRGARAVLDAAAMRHCDALGGVLMSYADARLAGTTGRETRDDGTTSDSSESSSCSEASTSDEESAIGFGRVLQAADTSASACARGARCSCPCVDRD